MSSGICPKITSTMALMPSQVVYFLFHHKRYGSSISSGMSYSITSAMGLISFQVVCPIPSQALWV